MKLEYDALMKNDTWSLIPQSHRKKIIPCRWVYKIKKATQAESMVYKSRLVGKGYRKIFGVDYDDTYAHVFRLTDLRVLLAVAIHHKMFVHGIDVQVEEDVVWFEKITSSLLQYQTASSRSTRGHCMSW